MVLERSSVALQGNHRAPEVSTPDMYPWPSGRPRGSDGNSGYKPPEKPPRFKDEWFKGKLGQWPEMPPSPPPAPRAPPRRASEGGPSWRRHGPTVNQEAADFREREQWIRLNKIKKVRDTPPYPHPTTLTPSCESRSYTVY